VPFGQHSVLVCRIYSIGYSIEGLCSPGSTPPRDCAARTPRVPCAESPARCRPGAGARGRSGGGLCRSAYEPVNK
jgi:hypothetical protein